MKEIVLTNHAKQRMRERGVSDDDVTKAINEGLKEKAQRGLVQFRLNLEYNKMWDGRLFRIKQVLPVVSEKRDKYIVVTVYAFYFQEIEEK